VHSPVEVVFKLDLSGVLQVRAKHVPSGKDATVVFANSPYRLTAQKRQAARAQVEALRAASPAEPPSVVVSDSDLSLAEAMMARARKALDGVQTGTDAARRASECLQKLSRAVSAKDAAVPALTDELSDALLDLM